MADLTQIAERINTFLSKQGLERIPGTPAGLEALFSGALRSIWRHPDKNQREQIVFAVINELKKYFGGKKIEEIYVTTKAELEALEARNAEQAARQAQQDKKKDPNHVPSFDELFGKD